MMNYFLFFIAAIVGGTINALAGGGGLITFPLLMLVVTPVTADATSAFALFFAYPTAVWRTRNQLEGVFGRGWLWLLLIPSVLGGFMGAVLLSRTDTRSFIELVPWLVLVATVIIVLRPILVRRDESGSVHPDITLALWPVAIAGIFLVGLYGGYFGSGIGILMIGALSFISRGDIRHVVALKNFLTLCMRGAAILVLVLEANVNWSYGVPMAIGGLIGGYIGAMISHRANRAVVRGIVIAIGFAASAYYFWKLYGGVLLRAGGE
ncbi:MAG: sulfite exporter TauE/SafE family protein [Nitrospirota bacterium]